MRAWQARSGNTTNTFRAYNRIRICVYHFFCCNYAAHGNNIQAKNLWPEMFRFVKESNAPVVFGENVTIKAIEKAKADLKSIGYKVERCRCACMDL